MAEYLFLPPWPARAAQRWARDPPYALPLDNAAGGKRLCTKGAKEAEMDQVQTAPLRAWAQKTPPKRACFNGRDEGGQFAAAEQPGLVIPDPRETLRSVR